MGAPDQATGATEDPPAISPRSTVDRWATAYTVNYRRDGASLTAGGTAGNTRLLLTDLTAAAPAVCAETGDRITRTEWVKGAISGSDGSRTMPCWVTAFG